MTNEQRRFRFTDAELRGSVAANPTGWEGWDQPDADNPQPLAHDIMGGVRLWPNAAYNQMLADNRLVIHKDGSVECDLEGVTTIQAHLATVEDNDELRALYAIDTDSDIDYFIGHPDTFCQILITAMTR